MDNVEIRWKRVISQPFAENTYIVWRDGCPECLIIDPGLDPDQTERTVRASGLAPVAILNTHGHSDHIAGNEACKLAWPDAPLIIGHGDAPKLTDPYQNLSAAYGLALVSPPADQTVRAGETLELAGIKLEVRETPGHSAGHVVFICRPTQPLVVLGGDVLFRGSVGRVDFPDGDGPQLVQSIRSQLFTLPDDTIVLPGHGEPTTTGHEKEFNPYVGRNASALF